MKYDIHTIPNFDRKLKKLSKKYKSLVSDLKEWVKSIRENPYVGVDLGNGLRKIRMSISDKRKGKSGGARIITYTMEIDKENGRITLLTIYDKSEQDSISKQDIEKLLTSLQ